jgi:hypothetical protein
MGQVLQELLPVGLVLFQQLDLLIPFLTPFLYILPHFINTFLGQDVFEIHLLFFGGLGLMDQFVDQFDLPVDELFERKKDQAVTTRENDQEGSGADDGIARQYVDATGDGQREQDGRKCG